MNPKLLTPRDIEKMIEEVRAITSRYGGWLKLEKIYERPNRLEKVELHLLFKLPYGDRPEA